MATIRLYLDSRSKRADGTSAIRIAVNNHGKTAYITLGQYCRADEWDKRLCRVRKRPDKDAINDFLLDRLNTYNKILMQLQCREDYRGNISAIALRDMILREADPNASAITLHDMFVRYTSREMRDSTRNNYLATWRSIEKFDKSARSLTLEEINRDWVERYNLFLVGHGRSHNTRTVRIRHIAAVFNYAIDNEITDNFPFRRLNLSIDGTRNRDLKLEDIRSIFSADVPERRRGLLDAFKAMFFLIGINLHDMYDLRHENVIDGRIEYVRLKTGKRYSILIQPELKEIMEKYKGASRLFSFCEKYKNANSFSISMNNALRSIREGLTTYYARHTWATLAFKMGISKDTISLALGHSFGVRVTSVYINADLSRVDEANRRLLDFVLYNKK